MAKLPVHAARSISIYHNSFRKTVKRQVTGGGEGMSMGRVGA